MEGQRIKETLARHRITLTSVAAAINYSLQNLSACLKGYDVRTGLLEKISEVTNIPVPEFYGFTATPTTLNQTGGDGSTQVAGNGNRVSAAGIERLSSQLERKDKQIEWLQLQVTQLQNQVTRLQGAIISINTSKQNSHE